MGPQQTGQQQWPGQGQPGGRDGGVVKQSGEAAGGIAAAIHVPDDQIPRHGPGPLPTQGHLPQPGDQDGHRPRHQPATATLPRFRGIQIDLPAPESPEQRQPVEQAPPGQVSTHRLGGSSQQQPRHHQQHPVQPIAPIGRKSLAPCGHHQASQQQHSAQQSTAGQEEQSQLHHHPAPARHANGAVVLQAPQKTHRHDGALPQCLVFCSPDPLKSRVSAGGCVMLRAQELLALVTATMGFHGGKDQGRMGCRDEWSALFPASSWAVVSRNCWTSARRYLFQLSSLVFVGAGRAVAATGFSVRCFQRST